MSHTHRERERERASESEREKPNWKPITEATTTAPLVWSRSDMMLLLSL